MSASPVSDVQLLLDAAVSGLGGAARPGQQRMAQAVADTFATAVAQQSSSAEGASAQRSHLVVQAGTGTGKSLAYLVPALAHASTAALPVIVSTATIALQRQLVERDLPRLVASLENHLPGAPTFALLKGRNNYLCKQKLSGGSAPEPEALLAEVDLTQVGRQVLAIRDWAETTEDGDRDNLPHGVSDLAWRQVSVSSRECVGAAHCPFGDSCFAELARAQAQQADVIVTNHALLAIDAMSDNTVLPEHEFIIVDEAHELEARVTNVATAEFSPSAIAITSKRAAKLLPKDSDAADRVDAALDDWTATLTAALDSNAVNLHAQWQTLPGSFEQPLAALRDSLWKLNRSINTLEANEDTSAERHAVLASTEELHDTIVRVLSLEGTNSNDVVWLSEDERKILYVAPLQIAELLTTRLFSSATVVLTSATLALGGSFTAMLAAWGLPKSTRTLDVGTPFQAATHGILYTAAHLPAPTGGNLQGKPASDEMVDVVAQLMNAAGGRTLGLFSSRRAAEYMAEQIRQVSDIPILLQGEDSLSSLVEAFREDPTTSLFGTLGLWQGVDVPGPSLQLVFMDRIPFPRPNDPLVQARQQAAAEAGRNGFMEVAASHAALLMAQGSGRLLRSVHDKGVVAVLDSRLHTARYGAFLRASMPDFWQTTDLQVAMGALRRLNSAANNES